MLRSLDRFHAIPDVPARAESWAEWLYFNGRAGSTRFYLTYLVGPVRENGRRAAGVRLQLERGGTLRSYSDTVNVTDEELESAPDLSAGRNTVRLVGSEYRIHIDLPAESGGPRASGDIVVRAAPDGTWQVEINPDTLPRVLVNRDYYATVSRHTDRNSEDYAFLNECLQTANWLTRSLDQRARTIMKVATEIVRQQDAFLMHGVDHLRPLNLKTVAEAIKMHESTVSRVTSNKYMLTPRGLFELKYFFTVSIGSAEGGDSHSAESVRHRIRTMITQELPDAVLSDDDIVDILRKGGVDLARRTVAKYREAMNIPSSVQRRREKRAMAKAAAS